MSSTGPAGSSGDVDSTESLRQQLAIAMTQIEALQARLDQSSTHTLTQEDYANIAAMMSWNQDITDDRTHSPSYPLEIRRTPKQPDPPLFSDEKDPTFTS